MGKPLDQSRSDRLAGVGKKAGRDHQGRDGSEHSPGHGVVRLEGGKGTFAIAPQSIGIRYLSYKPNQ